MVVGGCWLSQLKVNVFGVPFHFFSFNSRVFNWLNASANFGAYVCELGAIFRAVMWFLVVLLVGCFMISGAPFAIAGV